ncbi:thiopeptide-type bacteriocin biosynthesis protein [Nocardiopsis quinghaiensis]|uniref:thiopeptide-type bacteriocin biosynthesis protein n=1 Tax=Nocardiopsis quinghaiensis TaxID=464995 RepID=UPI001238F232|nr:thiopeptide-type bacteriocin biosynthesis protein [Nocardiopsis quinghaiensis]
MDTPGTEHPLTRGVLDVLAGTPTEEVATLVGLAPGELTEAVETYTTAGNTALQTRTADDGWHQVHIEFTEWRSAETVMAERLRPRLQRSGAVDTWWFIRKAPCWRLRLRSSSTAPDADTVLGGILEGLPRPGTSVRWARTRYEPEAWAFGGTEAMRIAHNLFHTDSASFLDYLCHHTATIGRRELSLLLLGALLRGADQDEYEQGDVWHRVTRMRPLPADVPPARVTELGAYLRRLLAARALSEAADNPLAFAAPWEAAFTSTGRYLHEAAHTGTLHRGLRAVLAHHVIFHWNRIGLPARTQSILAHAALTLTMGVEPADDQRYGP